MVQGTPWQDLSPPCLPQGRMSAWSPYVCIRALHLTSSAPAACCHLRTTCALPGTEGRVPQGMVSRQWYQGRAEGKDVVGISPPKASPLPQVARSLPPPTITRGSCRT